MGAFPPPRASGETACRAACGSGHLARAIRRALLTSAAAALAVPASPQADNAPLEIEEVIVTVERREQSVQDVAATVQVFNDEELLKLAINSDFANLQYAVPGLQIAKQEGKLEVYLRGIGSADSDFSSDPSVATHYNGVYLPRPRGIGPLFFDSERVEINKGPQGTLRGRNATGGTINIISKKPQFDAFGGQILGGIGNFDGRELQGVVNIPINDELATRFSVWSKFHDGLYTNAFGGADDFRTPSEQDDLALRAALRWEPTEAAALNLQWFNAEVKSTGDPGTFGGRSLAFGYDVSDLDDPWDQYFRTEGNFEQDVETVLVQAEYDFGRVGLEYNGSVNRLRAYNQNASREWQLGFNFPGSEVEAEFIADGIDANRNLLTNDTFSQADRSKSYTHELRAFATGDSRLFWTTGLFFFEEEFDYFSWDVGSGSCADSTAFVGSMSPVGPNTVSCWQNGLGGENRGDDSEVQSLAFFADAEYELNERFRVKGGYRYTDEEKIQRDSNAQYQFNFNADFFFNFRQISETSDLIIGEQGFTLTQPGSRDLKDYRPGDSGLAFFQDGIQEYGLGDNWGDLLDSCREGFDCEVIITSIFDPNGDRGTIRATNGIKDHYKDWRVGVEYDYGDDGLLYATLSTGTRSGGINRPLILADGRQLNTAWLPEELTSYEIGSKNTVTLGGREMLLNVTGFYYNYDKYVAQVLVDVPNPTPSNPDGVTQQVLTDNVSDSRIIGIELEAGGDLPKGLNFGARLLLMDSEFRNSEVLDPRTSNNALISIDGNQLPNVSKVNLNLRLSQNLDFATGRINSADWTVNVLYRSKYYLTPFNNKGYAVDNNGNTIEIPLSQMTPPANNGALSGVGGEAGPNFFSDVVDNVVVVNATAGINFGDADQYRLDAYVENLFEEAYSTKAFVNSSVNIRYLNAPRIYGVRFRAFFE